MLSRRTGAAALGVTAVCALGWACLKPTQITLHVTTDVDCAVVAEKGASIYGGATPTDPITTTKACDGAASPHTLGTFVLAPSGGKDEAIAFSVVAGVRRPSEQCAANDNDGCIVARRRIRFSPHDPLDLPIDLSLACLDVKCGDERTCSQGRCVKLDVGEGELSCAGPDCGVPPLSTGDGGASSDSASDAPATADAGVDAHADADAATGGFMMTHPSAPGAVFGLAGDADALYWVQAQSPTSYQIYRLLWQDLPNLDAAQPLLVTDSTTPLFGIAVTGAQVFVALGSTGCYGAMSTAGGQINSTTCTGVDATGGFGVARAPGTSPPAFVTLANPNGPMLFYANKTSTVLGRRAYYAEYDGTGNQMMVALGGGLAIVSVDATDVTAATPVTLPSPPSGAPFRGIALSPLAMFVSSTDGTVVEVPRNLTSPSVTHPAPMNITAAEDILYRVPTSGVLKGDIFMATAQGIYFWPNIEGTP